MFHIENQFPKRPRLSETLTNEVCLKFQRGCCDYGDRCFFAHCTEDLRGFEKRQEQQLIAVDEDKNPRYSEKTKLCWRFMNGEKCQFGEKCHFIHLRSERTSAAISVLNNGRKQFSWRTKLCKRWMLTGSCRYGVNCCYAHGESELQNQGLIDAQGYARGGPCELVDKKVEGKQLKVKWENNEKISRVYADWISDMPLVSHTI